MEITSQDRENAKKVLANFKAQKTGEEKFYCLCFSLLSPQTTYKSNMKVMAELWKRDFFHQDIDIKTLKEILKPVRFYNNKSRWLLGMKAQWNNINAYFDVHCPIPFKTVRDDLVDRVVGLGYKTASMFLRDLGIGTDYAIIDVHILKYLKEPLPSNKKQYLRLEQIFNNKAKELNMTPAELDTIVWIKYSNTPWEKVVY